MAAPNEDDIAEEYDEDFDEEEEKGAAAPAAPSPAPASGSTGSKSYTFVLFEGEDEKCEVKIATNAKWADFLSAASAKLGYDVASIKYDDEFGEKKEEDIVCKSADDWEDMMAMMEDDAEHIKGELSVEVTKKAGAPASAKEEAKSAATESKAGSEGAKEQPPSLLGDNAARVYTFVLFQGDDEKGEVRIATNAKWADFLSSASAKLGFDVGSIKYDDDFGEQKEQDIACKTANDWEDLMAMMEDDAEHIKGELSVEVTAKAAASAAADEGQITIKCFVGDNVKISIPVTASTSWSEVLAKISGSGGYTSFDYETDAGADIVCEDDQTWALCLKVSAPPTAQHGLLLPNPKYSLHTMPMTVQRVGSRPGSLRSVVGNDLTISWPAGRVPREGPGPRGGAPQARLGQARGQDAHRLLDGLHWRGLLSSTRPDQARPRPRDARCNDGLPSCHPVSLRGQGRRCLRRARPAGARSLHRRGCAVDRQGSRRVPRG